jgi:hypothetical protein
VHGAGFVGHIKSFWKRNITGYDLWCYMKDGALEYQAFPSWWMPGRVLDMKQFRSAGKIESFDPKSAIVVALNGSSRVRYWSHGPFSVSGGGHFNFKPWRLKLVEIKEQVSVTVFDGDGDRVTLPVVLVLEFLDGQNLPNPRFSCPWEKNRQSLGAVVAETIRRTDENGNGRDRPAA